MSVDVDFIPHLIMKDSLLTSPYERRNSWSISTSSSSSSSSAATSSTTTASPSWLERKLFSHFKRIFRRKSSSVTSNSSVSSRLPSSNDEDIPSAPIDEQIKEETKENNENKSLSASEDLSLPSVSSEQSASNPIELLYDYDRLLARCMELKESDRAKMIVHSQAKISIPHANLAVNRSQTIVMNWKSYVRLFLSLNRDAYLFQQYINQYFKCHSSINQHDQLTLNIRTTKNEFDNLLRKFLDEYVTCLTCLTAQTYLVKYDRIWNIECRLCGTQRTVKRLRWKRLH